MLYPFPYNKAKVLVIERSVSALYELLPCVLSELETECFSGTLAELQAEYHAAIKEREEANKKDQERCYALLMQYLSERPDKRKGKRKRKSWRVNNQNVKYAMDFSGPFYSACVQLGIKDEIDAVEYLRRNKDCDLMKKFRSLGKSPEFLRFIKEG